MATPITGVKRSHDDDEKLKTVFKKFCEILRCKKMLVNVCKFSNLTVINV